MNDASDFNDGNLSALLKYSELLDFSITPTAMRLRFGLGPETGDVTVTLHGLLYAAVSQTLDDEPGFLVGEVSLTPLVDGGRSALASLGTASVTGKGKSFPIHLRACFASTLKVIFASRQFVPHTRPPLPWVGLAYKETPRPRNLPGRRSGPAGVCAF